MKKQANNPQSSVETVEVVNTEIVDTMKMTVSIEQGEHSHETSFSFAGETNIGTVANILLNEVYSMVSIQRLTKVSKNRPSLNKPFTFALAFECGDKSLAVPDFQTKITFADKGIEKLIENMPAVIAELVVSKTIPFQERRKAIKEANNVQLVLS